MSSSQNFMVYKTLPYSVYARAMGKWDYLQENQFFNSSQVLDIAMQNYDGLSMTAETQQSSALPLNFSATVLPWKWDYYNYLLENKYCFMPAGQWYSGVAELGLNIVERGSLTIDSNYEVSGFTTSKYLETIDVLPSNFTTWDIMVSFSVKGIGYQSVLCHKLMTGMKLFIENAKLKVNISSNGTSQNVASGVSGTTTIQTNTQYWVKASYDGTTYSVKLSTTGAFAGEETTEIAVVGDKNLGGNVITFGVGSAGGSLDNPLNGTIYLGEIYINIDGASWWKAVDYTPIARQGCTYNYTDDGSAVTLNAFVVNNDETIVLTQDNSYTNGYLLGTVSIPAHTVYSYSETIGTWTQSVLSANGTIGGDSFAVAASTESSSNYPAWKAFDSNSSTYFRSSTNDANKWLEFYSQTAVVVTRVDITNASDYFIQGWEFQYSDDGAAWSVLTSGTSTAGATDEWGFDVTNSGAHKYYRLKVLSASATSFAVAEMSVTAHTVTPVWTAVE